MATGGYAGTGTAGVVKFVKLSGEEIPYQAPPNSTLRDVAPDLAKFFPGGSVRLIDESGKLFNSNDPLPQEGILQVQVMGIAPGDWSDLYFGALEGFQELPLREALEAAWPGDYQGSTADETQLDNWQQATFSALQTAVVTSCGDWADYWSFGSSADSYGYWYVRPPYPTMAPSVNLIVNDVKRWQKILLDLEEEFAHLRSRCSGFELCEHLEIAIAALLRHCPDIIAEVTWHVGFEMWYLPFADLVSWYLSSTGLEETHRNLLEAVTNAIHGFDSYGCPPKTAAIVASQVAPTFQKQFEKVDSTAEWLVARATMVAPALSSTAPADARATGEDSHLRFIDSVDAARDSERAANLRYALHQCRKDAKAGSPLEFENLLQWQYLFMRGHTTVERGCFRKHDAYAKRGRECYPLEVNTESKFKELLAQANSSEPLALRAARAYLDVCFFHPFDDCNSRMARLVLDFLLTREGYTLGTVEPIFLFARSARDAEGARGLVEQVQQLMVKVATAEWEKPLTNWIDQHPDHSVEQPDRWDHRWFSCQRYPEDK
eukprot:s3301_g4.t1